MKKLLFLILLLSTLSGCAWYDERISAANACLQDPACYKPVQDQVNFWKVVAGASGFPYAATATGVIATAILLFFARKKKQ